MQKIIIQPTEIAHWYSLVNEAQVLSDCDLGEEIESYLVFLLMRFHKNTSFVDSILALDFFASEQAKGSHKLNLYQELGDKSLLFSGLYPEQAHKRHVNLDYFIDMGRGAYATCASLDNENASALFYDLSIDFLKMRDVLYAIKEKSIA